MGSGVSPYRVPPDVLVEEGVDTLGALDATPADDPDAAAVGLDPVAAIARLEAATAALFRCNVDRMCADLDVADAEDRVDAAAGDGAAWLLRARAVVRRAVEDGVLPSAERGVIRRVPADRFPSVRDRVRLGLAELARMADGLVAPGDLTVVAADGAPVLAALDAAHHARRDVAATVAAADRAVADAVAALVVLLRDLDAKAERVRLRTGRRPMWGTRAVLRLHVRAAAGRARARRGATPVAAT